MSLFEFYMNKKILHFFHTLFPSLEIVRFIYVVLCCLAPSFYTCTPLWKYNTIWLFIGWNLDWLKFGTIMKNNAMNTHSYLSLGTHVHGCNSFSTYLPKQWNWWSAGYMHIQIYQTMLCCLYMYQFILSPAAYECKALLKVWNAMYFVTVRLVFRFSTRL